MPKPEKRPAIARAVQKFLECGDLEQGFARVRCPDCAYEFFVAFSCRGGCFGPSWHRKRALQTAHWGCQSFIERHQTEVIEKSLRHWGLWEEETARGSPAEEEAVVG